MNANIWYMGINLPSSHLLPCFIHDRVTKYVLQAGMEKLLAESLLDISRKTHESSGIKTYHVPHLPRRVYIESPGIVEIQEIGRAHV